jgi:hypothetical protein
MENSEMPLSQGPLQYILSQESLRWAWYITMLLLLVYAIFYGKRRQRVIPVIEENKNTSLEFVQTIGQLYYQERNHKVLCMHKMKLFLQFIRNRYFIHALQMSDEVIQKISVKSQVAESEIRNIFTQYNWIDRTISVTAEELVEFHQLIENFYNQCK